VKWADQANPVHRIPSNCLLPAILPVSPVRLVLWPTNNTKSSATSRVTGHVTFGKVDEKSTYNAEGTTYPLPGFQLAVQLDVHLPGLDKAEAEKLVEQAHQVCPYSRATRNNIEVKFAIV